MRRTQDLRRASELLAESATDGSLLQLPPGPSVAAADSATSSSAVMAGAAPQHLRPMARGGGRRGVGLARGPTLNRGRYIYISLCQAPGAQARAQSVPPEVF